MSEEKVPTKEEMIQFLNESIEITKLRAELQTLNTQIAVNRAEELKALAFITQVTDPKQHDTESHTFTQEEIDAQHTIEILTKLGWYSFESTTYERWDIDTLKEWCDSNCLGKYRLFYHTCLFENMEDAVKFNLVWG